MTRPPIANLLFLMAIFACVHGAPRGKTSTDNLIGKVRRLDKMNMGMGMDSPEAELVSDPPSDIPSENPSNVPSDVPSDMPSDVPSLAPELPTANLEDTTEPQMGMGMGMGGGTSGMGGMGSKRQ